MSRSRATLVRSFARVPWRGPQAFCAVAWLAVAVGASALEPVSAQAPREPAFRAPLEALDPAERRLWREGFALEEVEDFEAATARYVKLAEAHPSSAFIAWRIARNHWRQGERLPVDAKGARHEAFSRALDWADRAIRADPECGECVFWKMASMGRLATTVGAVRSASMAAPIAALIDRGIALNPSFSDNEWNHTLGNLYFAASAFYRLLPDWFWLEWVIGVRGDTERSLDYIERALAISPQRVDYNLELGVVLTCLGTQRQDPVVLARGRQALSRARALPQRLGTDPVDKGNAELIQRRPELACGYSRDGFIDFSEVERAGAL